MCWWCTTTLHLSVPAGWEGWGLHQPPRVQNRPSHRVQTEIVSVPHVSLKLLIKHICYTHTTWSTKTLISLLLPTDCSAFKACHPKIKSFFFATDCLEEMNRWASGHLSERVCVLMWTIVRCWGRHVSFHEYFNWVNQVYTRQQPTQHHAWIRHEPGPLLLNVELCV